MLFMAVSKLQLLPAIIRQSCMVENSARNILVIWSTLNFKHLAPTILII